MASSETWTVDFDAAAVIDFEDVKSRAERKAVFTVVEKLRALGPRLPSPHMKSLKGEVDLFELRPKQGRSPVRPIYSRFGGRFVILAIASDKSRLDAAIKDARGRTVRRDRS